MKNFLFFLLIGFFLSGCFGGTPFNSSSEVPPSAETLSDIDIQATEHGSEKKISPSQIVSLNNGDRYEMIAEIISQKVGNKTIKRLAYNGQIPGPLLQVEKGSTITLVVKNQIDIPTTLHSHGLRLNDAFDGVLKEMGGKQDPIIPGGKFEYTLTFPDTGVYWYHPHIREDYTQELGLYGNFSVTQEKYWNEVDREEFLIVDDFLEDGEFFQDVSTHVLRGRFGNVLLINDQKDFSLKAKTGEKIRFFLTNVANTRTFDISLKNPNGKKTPFILVGGDIGRIEQETAEENIIIAPAERYVMETSFSESGEYTIDHRGKIMGTIIIEGENTQAQETKLRTNIQDYAFIRENIANWVKKSPDKILRTTLGHKGRGEMKMGGGMMRGNGMMSVESEKIIWEEDIPMNARSNSNMLEWRLVDEHTGRENMDISWKFKKGDFVKVRIFNDPEVMHSMQHPIHFHGQRFVVLSTNSVVNKNFQWKDTTLVQTGDTVDIIVDMSNPGKWMAHCHIAEHLHGGMMFNFEVNE